MIQAHPNNSQLTIIVPVFNVEQYLEECLDSIQASCFTDYQALLIDDGSIDSSGKICDEFAAQDSRFHAYHLTNRGVSAARNYGLSQSNSPYIMFIDSDDLIEPDFLQETIIKGEEDFSFSGYKDYYSGNTLRIEATENRYYSIQEFREKVKTLGRAAIPFCVWRGCYRSKIIKENNICFDEQCGLGEDILFNLDYFECCKKIRETVNSGYLYRQVHTSLRHKYYPEMTEKHEREVHALEQFACQDNMRWRYYGWHVVLQHYSKWADDKDGQVASDAKKRLKKAYKSKYFRESIPYIRKEGSTDEKIETHFMNYYSHWFFEMLLKGYQSVSS